MRILKKADIGLEIIKARLLRKNTPLYVQLAVTNRCNLSCRYCNIPNRKTEELSTEEIFSIIDQLVDLGTKRVTILGGEPLLRNDIGKIISYLKRKDIYCGLTTNGYFVKSRLHDIKDLDTIAISIDGDEKENDCMRGEGSYQKAIEALYQVKEIGIPVVLSVTMVKANIDSLDSVLKLARKFNCQALINIAYHSNISSLSAKENLATNLEYKSLIKKILVEKKKGAPILLSDRTYRYVLKWPDYFRDKIVSDNDKCIPQHSSHCQAGKLFCYIDADGNIYPCALNVGEVEALNCIEVGVEKAWRNSSNHNCRACCVACFVEYNSIFSLNPNVIFNTIKFHKR